MKEYSISVDHIRAINYSLIGAYEAGVKKHPQLDMKDLGINLLGAVPESIADCWNCITDYQGELPEYISEYKVQPHDSYWKHWGIDIVK